MTALSLGFAIATTVLLFQVTLHILLNHGWQRKTWLFTGFVASASMYVLHAFLDSVNGPIAYIDGPFAYFGVSEAIAGGLYYFAWLMAEMGPWALWGFIYCVCRDEKVAAATLLVPGLLIVILNLIIVMQDFNAPLLLKLSNAANFALLLYTLHELVFDLRADLSDSRRKFRNLVAITLIVAALVLFYIEINRVNWPQSQWLLGTRFAAMIVALLISMVYFRAVKSTAQEIFEYCEATKESAPRLSQAANKLLHDMQAKGLYLNPQLNLTRLATQMEIPEYRLRNLILTELGYRNFNTFINQFRVKHAASLMQSCETKPLNQIFKESGFKSHPTFNRSFREEYGCAPSDYRVKIKDSD